MQNRGIDSRLCQDEKTSVCWLFILTIQTGFLASLLAVLLFGDAVWGAAPSFMGSAMREATAVFRDSKTQWMVFICLGIYFTIFLFLRSRAAPAFWTVGNLNLWLASGLLISTIVYITNYSPSLQALTLLGGPVLGQAIVLWAGFYTPKLFSLLLVSILVILLATASFWHVDIDHVFVYHNLMRWYGPWDNPNIFGLLMGTGMTLAVGLALGGRKMKDGGQKTGGGVWCMIGERLPAIVCLLAAMFMGRGLLHSYSRGAWLATGCGGMYLAWHRFHRATRQTPDKRLTEIAFEPKKIIATNWLPLAFIFASIFALVFWHFGQTDWHPARRAFSAIREEDFSSRNRISAWEGTLQIMAEHPWIGTGWNQSEPLYEHHYLPSKLTEHAAIEMNGYLMLGTTLGVPALFCFGIYLWLSLGQFSKCKKPEFEVKQHICCTLSGPFWTWNWPQTVCCAGAIVLSVGFWFDGGLFKLPTAATFWILLELGRDKELINERVSESVTSNKITRDARGEPPGT